MTLLTPGRKPIRNASHTSSLSQQTPSSVAGPKQIHTSLSKFHFADNLEVKAFVYQSDRTSSHSSITPVLQLFYSHLIGGAGPTSFLWGRTKVVGTKIETAFWDGCTIWGPCLAFSRDQKNLEIGWLRFPTYTHLPGLPQNQKAPIVFETILCKLIQHTTPKSWHAQQEFGPPNLLAGLPFCTGDVVRRYSP